MGNVPEDFRLALAPNPKKVRVFELAKDLRVESKIVLDFCKELGYDVKNQLSNLETTQVDALRTRVAKGGKAGGGGGWRGACRRRDTGGGSSGPGRKNRDTRRGFR